MARPWPGRVLNAAVIRNNLKSRHGEIMSVAESSSDHQQKNIDENAEESRYKLKDAVDINALTTDLGTVLEIDPIETFDNALEHDRDFAHDYDSRREYFSMGKDEDGKDLRGCPGRDSFRKFEEKMTNVTDDGQVKKWILREGHGPTVPDGSVVKVHYNAFYERSEDPFDSSFTQGKPQKFSLLDCVPGLGIALGSMRRQERAQFLVQPGLAYGALGVPPRIPANAEILYEIELLSFTEGEVDGKKKKKTFAQVMMSARAKVKKGKDHFMSQNYFDAHSEYARALRLLTEVSMADDAEEDEQKKLLLKVYTNLASCLVHEQKPRQACNMCKGALRIKPDHVRALFLFGRALLLLQDFPSAEEKLCRANSLEPGNVDIREELTKLKQKQAEYKRNETLFARKMFS